MLKYASITLNKEALFMTVTDVLEHFDGKSNTAKALGINYQAVDQWEKNGRVPDGRQWQIQAMINGKLKAEEAKTA